MRVATTILVLVAACATRHQQAAQIDAQHELQAEIPVALPTHMTIRVPVEALGGVPGFAGVEGQAGVAAKLPRPRRALPGPLPEAPAQLSGLYADIGIDFAPAPTPAKLREGDRLKGKSEDSGGSKPSFGIPALGLVLAGLAAAAVFTRSLWIGPLVTLAKRLLGRG